MTCYSLAWYPETATLPMIAFIGKSVAYALRRIPESGSLFECAAPEGDPLGVADPACEHTIISVRNSTNTGDMK
jgi:hypothetical protein